MSEPARSFQHYEVLRREDGTAWELGRGAMGITYKAFDVNLCCEVALKVVSTALVEHPEARERFVREARAAAALRHRNVASVYHLGNDGEHFFYAMEFINGETLDALVRRSGPLSVQDTLRVVLQVARALAAAARQNLVHRDIKPANLMVTHEDADEETVVKVIDFGLARAAANTENAPPLTIGGFVGTPQFASPEQLEERPLDARSDLYSLGVTTWFLLTGRVPFSGSLATVCQQQLTRPPPWEHLPTDLPACVRLLMERLLEKLPARRPQTAVELRAEIENCLDHVQGTQRRRDLHLPALAAENGASTKNRAKHAGRSVQAGTLLNGRYRLLRENGDCRGGTRVFQARDESKAGTPVAVKILPDEISSSTALRNRWEEAARLAQAAPHANLVEIIALERSLSPDAVFLVEEWVAGWTLRDLLAGRGGALPVVEALRLLAQAAAAADHAERCRLEHLDLGPLHLHVCLSAVQTSTAPASQPHALLRRSMAEWPDWTLKTHAICFADDPQVLDTWAGGETLLPAAQSRADMRPAWTAGRAGCCVPALARLVYELLGGRTPGHRDGRDLPSTRFALLPALNEEANSLLRATLSGEAAFAHGWQWHDAFARAVGDEPARGETPVPVDRPIKPAAADDLIPVKAGDDFPSVPAFAPAESATLFHHLHDHNNVSEFGSAWDRLTLVGEKRTHPGRWVAGILSLAAVFVLVFAGVLGWLLQRPAARAAVASDAPTRTREQATVPASRPVSTPAPLVADVSIASPTARPKMASTPLAAPERVEKTPVPSATAFASVENAPPTPVPADPIPAPPRVLSTTMVRMDSVPEGAQIRLGDELLGVTPCRVRLPRGDHQLIARYQDWPETRQTIHLDGTETRLAVEIRLMRPDLVPGLATLPSVTPDVRSHRIPAPTAHPAIPIPPGSPTPGESEPEVRPAQRVLTPFRIDEPENALPSAPPTPVKKQPFSADDPDNQ